MLLEYLNMYFIFYTDLYCRHVFGVLAIRESYDRQKEKNVFNF